MKRVLKIGYLILLPLFFVGCRKDQWNDCFQGTGKDITDVRHPGSFTKLNIGEKFDIILTQDTSQTEEIKITAGSHIIGQIVTKVNNNTLTIENKNTCNFVRSYDRKIKIEIRVKFLDDIKIFSATNLSTPDTLHFELKTLKLKNLGLGDVNLKINAGFLDIRTINSGNLFLEGFANIMSCSIEEITVLDARKLLCHDCYIDTFTPLDCFVNAQKKLFVNIFNKGNVYHVSEPSEKKEVTIHNDKNGRLLKLN